MKLFPLGFALFLATFVGCTTRSNFVGSGADAGAAPVDDKNLPEVDASELGQKCSGFGTSIGDTAAFPTDKCPAGMCVVDARDGLELYCSADCTQVRCPDGWTCELTSVGNRRVCFGDPNATIDPKVDAGPTDHRDVKLTGYRAGASSSKPIALREFQDATRRDRDLVVLVIGSTWDFYTRPFLKDEANISIDRTLFVSVLIEGAKPNTPATAAEFTTWHKALPQVDMLLDPGFATLAPTFSQDITAVPTFVGLDAKTLEPVGEMLGATAVAEEVEKWRAALP